MIGDDAIRHINAVHVVLAHLARVRADASLGLGAGSMSVRCSISCSITEQRGRGPMIWRGLAGGRGNENG